MIPPIILLVLKIGFLLLLYLFVYRVIRAVVLDVFGPRPPKRRRRRGRQPAPLSAEPLVVPAASVAAGARSRRPSSGAATRSARSEGGLARALLVHDASGERQVPLTDSVTVGRAASCEVVLTDTFVSNVHARVFLRDGAYWVEDTGSTNGTFVNEARVRDAIAIGPGDQVRVGKTKMELRR